MSFRDLPDAPPPAEDPQEHIDEIEAAIVECEQLLAPFQTGAWMSLEGLVRGEYQVQLEFLLSPEGRPSGDEVHTRRGRLQGLSWVLNLPTKIQAEMNRLMNELEQARPTEGEEPDATG